MKPGVTDLLLTKSTYNQLTKTLLSIESAKTTSEINSAYDTLRDQLANIFSLKRIGQYPNQVMVDFAETIQGLYDERHDLPNYLFHIRTYLSKQMTTYKCSLERITKQAQRNARHKCADDISVLDSDYKLWTYTHGYYKQQTDMYAYLYDIIDYVLVYHQTSVTR